MGSQASAVSGSTAAIQQYSQGRITNHIDIKESSYSETLEEIYFCEQKATNGFGAANHAYLVVQTNEGNFYLCEIGGCRNNVQFIIKEFDGTFNFQFQAKEVNRDKTMSDLVNNSTQNWTNQTYDVIDNNCYDYCKSIIREFTDSSKNSFLINYEETGTMINAGVHLGLAVAGIKAGFLIGMNGGIAALGAAVVGVSELLNLNNYPS